MGKVKDLTGQRFGRLIAVQKAGNDKRGQTIWLCRCDCGRYKEVKIGALTSGAIQSCGCLRSEMSRNTHAKYHHKRLTSILQSMKTRCYNPNRQSSKYYYEKGIGVCDEWMDKRKGHDNFVIWALENGYSDDLTLDRIDCTKGYSPENCRWVSQSVQSFNRSQQASKTGVRGVYYKRKNGLRKYEVYISKDNKRVYLGSCSTIEEAKEMRQTAELKYYGQVLD